MENRLPTFFNYKEENSDYGYEAIQDFFLSWTLRCSMGKYKEVNPVINEYARKAMIYLIYGFNNDNFQYVIPQNNEVEIKEVRTYRQWERIDLLVEVDVLENSINKQYILNIENKWYTNVSDAQLKKSKNAVNNFYKSNEKNIINIVVFCDYSFLNDYTTSICKENGFKLLTIGDINEYMGINKQPTKNDLFDEYWVHF